MPVELKDAATFRTYIRRRMLKDSQFPDILTDDIGAFTKPPVWI